jgi:hypothetical protein
MSFKPDVLDADVFVWISDLPGVVTQRFSFGYISMCLKPTRNQFYDLIESYPSFDNSTMNSIKPKNIGQDSGAIDLLVLG